MNCKLCNTALTPANKCNAHIFPASLLKLLTPGEYGSLKVVGTDMDRSKKTPIGSYDSNILCSSCDNKIGVYDGYARTFVERSTLVPHASGVGWMITGSDQHKLKMFCISYLWRASITTRPEFRGVSLGLLHEERIHQMILDDDSGNLHDYTVSLQKFSNNDGKFGGILFPARTRLVGLNCYEGYLPQGYKFWVKVDSQNEHKLSSLSVGATEPLFIGDRGDFHSSVEKSIMVRAVRRSK
jgi:hypothetical protein